jgi:CBS domain-containing protein
MALVRDFMDSAPATVTPEMAVEEVVRVLRRTDQTGVPVVTESGRLLGIITESDLVMAGEEEDLHLPHYIELFGGIIFLESMGHFEERLKRATAAKARDMMTEEVVTIGPDEDVRQAARLISKKHHNRIPVVDGDGHLVGVITRADVLDALTRE